MDFETQQQIKQTLKTSISHYLQRQKGKPRKFHVLNYIFPTERYIRSLIGGLETSLGTTVWEPIARTLAECNGFTVCNPKQLLKPSPYPEIIQYKVSDLEERRKSGTGISLETCREEIRQVARSLDRTQIQSFQPPPPGKGVDIYLKKGNREYVFDIKTNQPNRRAGEDLNSQLLNWYAYRYCQDPDARFEARIAFPFNPFEQDWWTKQGDRIAPISPGEAWVEDEFWDFCSGEDGTWQQILDIFIELGQEENFSREFQDIFYSQD